MRLTIPIFRCRTLGCVLVSLCLALSVPGAEASVLVVQDAHLMATPAVALSSPDAMDCVPCARCYAAPAPSMNRVTGDAHEAETPAGQADPTQRLDSEVMFDAGGQRALLPLRIVYCRWRN